MHVMRISLIVDKCSYFYVALGKDYTYIAACVIGALLHESKHNVLCWKLYLRLFQSLFMLPMFCSFKLHVSTWKHCLETKNIHGNIEIYPRENFLSNEISRVTNIVLIGRESFSHAIWWTLMFQLNKGF